MSNQIIRVPFNGLVRIVASRDGSVRYNSSVGSSGKAVLNFTGVALFSNKDEEDPVWIDVSLWGDIATKYSSSIEHGQIARIDGQLELSLDEYGGETKMKGKLSCNNGYQFVLFPETVKPGNGATTPTPAPVAVEEKTIADDIPF